MCSCECITPIPECECGYEWDPHCCACELCFDKGLCNPRTEFYNPVTCQCDCMPTCCDEGEKWYQLTCSCGPFVCDPLADGYFICDDQTDPDCVLYPTSDRLLCYEMMNIFVDLVTDINTCTCSKQTNPNPPAECINPLNPAYYTVECCEDPRSPLFGSVECGAFEYAIHFTGCQLYLEYQTFDAVWTNWQFSEEGPAYPWYQAEPPAIDFVNVDVDPPIVIDHGKTYNDPTYVNSYTGDVCVDGNGNDYEPTKELMGSFNPDPVTGLWQFSSWYFVEPAEYKGLQVLTEDMTR